MNKTKSKFKKVRILLDDSEDLSILWMTTLSCDMSINEICWREEYKNESVFFLFALPILLYPSNK